MNSYPTLVEMSKQANSASAGPERLGAQQLEQGSILRFAPGQLPLPPEQDLEFLRSELARGMTLKNISYHAHGAYLSGLKGAARERTKAILHEHNRVVGQFLAERLPEYAQSWSVGKVNYRPLEERGRELSRHSSNELIHVDAFASGATHGGRTLRFFTNINPSQSRVWKSAGRFPELLSEFGQAAGVLPLGSRGLDMGLLNRAWSGFLKGLAKLGLPQALTADSSPYDRAMKRLHDTLKDDAGFQADASRFSFLEFEPYTSWVCLTDTVSHACVSGQHALVNTWTVPLEAMALPHLAPMALIQSAGLSSASNA